MVMMMVMASNGSSYGSTENYLQIFPEHETPFTLTFLKVRSMDFYHFLYAAFKEISYHESTGDYRFQ